MTMSGGIGDTLLLFPYHMALTSLKFLSWLCTVDSGRLQRPFSSMKNVIFSIFEIVLHAQGARGQVNGRVQRCRGPHSCGSPTTLLLLPSNGSIPVTPSAYR